MLKSAGLLLFLGLAVGLWLGFNPQAHRKVVQNWDNTKTSLARLETNFSTTISAWTTRAKAQEAQVGQKTVSRITTRPFAAAWQQFTAAGETFLQSMQKIWLGLETNLNIKKS